MKKIRCRTIIGILLCMLFLTGCGKETFTCGWCMKTVTQVPHEMTILGQKINVCNDCYKYLK